MALPSVSPADVAAYAPGAPAVTQGQVDEAKDWAEAAFENVSTPLPATNTREGRELKRAVSAYALSLLPGVQTLSLASSGQRLKSMKIVGEYEEEYAAQDGASLTVAASTWEDRAWLHLRAAGLPVRRVAIAGAVR